MNCNINIIENVALIITAIATFCAAIAALFSYKVSQNSLDFQKNFAKKQNLINELNRIILKVETLLILIPKLSTVSDEEFLSLEPLFLELKAELERLNTRQVIEYKSLKISTIEGFADLLDDESSLEEILQKLNSKIDEVFN